MAARSLGFASPPGRTARRRVLAAKEEALCCARARSRRLTRSSVRAAAESTDVRPRAETAPRGDDAPRAALLLVDHGSRRREANEMLEAVADTVRRLRGGGDAPTPIIEVAHMELASPSIADGVRRCVQLGASQLTVVPYFLSPGRHSTSDIPALVGRAVAELAPPHPEVSIAAPLGVHQKIAEVLLERAEHAVALQPPAVSPH